MMVRFMKIFDISRISILWTSEERKCLLMIVILASSMFMVSGKISKGKAWEEMLISIRFDLVTRRATALVFTLFCLSVALASFSISIVSSLMGPFLFSSRLSTSFWVYVFSGRTMKLLRLFKILFSNFYSFSNTRAFFITVSLGR